MSIESSSIAFCIVTYNEFFEDSITFNSLINSYNKTDFSSKIYIYVYDNTPSSNNKFSLNNETIYKDDIIIKYITINENVGLSKAYNSIASIARHDGLEWIVLLDQDTSLPDNFFEAYINSSPHYHLQAPRVFSGDVMISPAIYKNYRSFIINDIDYEFYLKNISCINSGLLVHLNLFALVGGYNEMLFLDFCDHDFITRIKKKYNKFRIIDINLKQEFSNDIHNFQQAFFRYRLFLNDLKKFQKNKDKVLIFLYVDLPRLLSLSWRFRTHKFVKYRLLKK